jgi:hypothetical protein
MVSKASRKKKKKFLPKLKKKSSLKGLSYEIDFENVDEN